MMSITCLIFLTIGLLGVFVFDDTELNELSYGFLALGIAYIGMTKGAMEMFENHRLDKKDE